MAGFVLKSPVPKPTEEAVVVVVAAEPRVPKLSPPVELNYRKNIKLKFHIVMFLQNFLKVKINVTSGFLLNIFKYN